MIIDDNVVLEVLETLELPFGLSNPAYMAYHRVFIRRYSNTLACLVDLPRNLKVLELAASPYGMTAILKRHLFDDLEVANFGQCGETRTVSLKVGANGYCFKETTFNAETDAWPYPDQNFDLIVCCEMLEHLAMDPMNVFAEANRVLRPGGRFFVSTPNASSFQNAVKCLAFKAQSLSPHYRTPMSLAGIYQRHNRELTPPALQALFSAGGFQREAFTTSDSYPFDNCKFDDLLIDQFRRFFSTDMRSDTMNFLGRKVIPVTTRYPTIEDLYLQGDHS
ncbi:class I SAM-dependent methyltransferase [Rhodopseudomonas palustris]|uniref:class I SAM-dependent methyltransferase n=1 Tax=Rhodopseudomonas palustris TaxID=1076 RepID=UPI0011C3F41D|nr:class I SAM-dependent methyltransferase [Rhodopseudomonas palustris]